MIWFDSETEIASRFLGMDLIVKREVQNRRPVCRPRGQNFSKKLFDFSTYVDNHKSAPLPANCISRNESKRRRHAIVFVGRRPSAFQSQRIRTIRE